MADEAPSSVTVSIEGERCTFQFSGDLMNEVANDFYRVYSKQKKGLKYTLDLTGVKRIDSTGFGMLLEMRELLEPAEQIEIANANNALKSLLHDLHLDQFYTVI